jgi:hypothetical protein
MRSDLVFESLGKVENRYTLCRVCAKGTRTLHVQTGRIEDTINEVLQILAKRSMHRSLDAPENSVWLSAASAMLTSYARA